MLDFTGTTILESMARRLFAVSTVTALLALHLGVACLAIARTHGSMPIDDTRCETGSTAQQKILCAAPSSLAPPVSPTLVPIWAASLAPPTAPPSVVLRVASFPASHGTAPPGAPPAFLVHRALLI
jgi:hypothetical protein